MSRENLFGGGNFVMKKFRGAFLVMALAILLLDACTPVVQTVEVTREVTRVVTQIVPVTPATPPPTITPSLIPSSTPRPSWTPSFTETPFRLLTMTPGIQVLTNSTQPEVEKFVSKQHIKDYLALQVGARTMGGKVFCGYQPLGIGNDGKNIQLYLWVLCQEYYWGNGGLKKGTGISIPVVLFVELRLAGYEIVNYDEPHPGFNLPSSSFPPEIRNFILVDLAKSPDEQQTWAKAISQEVEQEAKAYFGNQ
jgi:hypothetical protein